VTEVLAKKAGVNFLHVPYRGAAPLMTDLLAGRIAFCFTATTTALPYEQSGELRAIAVSTAERSKYFPNVATVAESGFPEIRSPTWFAIMAPAGTPAPILARLRQDIGAVSASSAYAALLDKHASDPMTMSVAESERFLAAERQLWSEAVTATGAIPG
jgi:tripartite-type tricarboxylate transporter receptor subunit TctC